MRSGGPKALLTSGPPGPSAVTRASALQDVIDAIKAVLTAADLPSARTALGLGNVANLAPADLGISTATSAALSSLSALVTANQTALNTLLGGANPAVDTFIEAYNRFVADESAAAAMNAALSALQAALTAETTRATAAEGTNATAISNEVTRATTAEGTKAPLASPTFTGTPAAPTATANTNTTQLATCAFVQSALGPYLTSVTAASTYATLASPNFTGTPTVPTAAPGSNTTQIASTAFVSAAVSAATGGASNAVLYSAQSLTSAQQRQALTNIGHAGSPVRQTVQSGPVASGAPSFLPSSTGTLALAFQNVSSTSPLVLSCAKGFPDGAGAADQVAVFTANPSVTLPASQAYVAPYYDFDAAAWNYSTLAPISQPGGTISTVNGQYTFDYQAMVGWVGNGTAAVRANRVYVGEGATSGSSVTSMAAYAYNGYFDSGWTSTLPAAGSTTIKSHNLGTQPNLKRLIVELLSSEGNYAAGEQVPGEAFCFSNGTAYTPLVLSSTRTAVSLVLVSGGGPWLLSNKSGGSTFTATTTSYKYKIIAQRGY